MIPRTAQAPVTAPLRARFAGVASWFVRRVRLAHPKWVLFGKPAQNVVDHPLDSFLGGKSPLYLIALKEGLIRPALSYRVEGTTLRYMDLDGAPNEVPLDRVDRALSAELNRQRRVPFQLPPEE